VVLSPDGTTDFNELERELGKQDGDQLTLMVFDLLYLDGFDLRPVPLLKRKEALQALVAGLPKDTPIRYSEHVSGNAAKLYQEACRVKLEGLVSKRADARYVSRRSDVWVKDTCRKRDTYAIVGWALKGRKFDGFYLGEEKGDKLVYAGKIEQGWTEEQKQKLLARVKPLKIARQPLAVKIDKPKAQWVEPRVLVDVEYRAKTAKRGLLRHPPFIGVREDLME
jgi:bifunctional non-homologous end joining protein LigD